MNLASIDKFCLFRPSTQLSPEELATQLTLDDYSVFRSIEAAEYVDKVFGLTTSTTPQEASTTAPDVSSGSSRKGFATGCTNLDAFADLVNKEAYWVPSELCAETNLTKRVDMLKRFIKVSSFLRGPFGDLRKIMIYNS